MSQNYLKMCEELVTKAKKMGASQAQVSISSGNKFSVDIRNGEIEQLVDAGSVGISLKVIVDNKIATSSSSDLSMPTLERLLGNAIERAKYTSPDEFGALPDLEKIDVNIDSLKLYDAQWESITPEQKIKLAQTAEKLCLADKRVARSIGAGFSNYIGETFMANSNGFSGGYKHSSGSYGVGLQAGEGDNVYEDGWYDSAVNFKGLMSAEEVAKKAIASTVRMVGAKKIKTQNVPVVLDPEMTASFMLGFFAECLGGSSIFMKRSFLADKINTQIAAKSVNIIDNALIPGAIGSQPFDGEGVPCRKTSIVENGMLKNYLLSTYSARKLKMKSTGHASGVTNFMMMPGKHSQEEIIKSVDKGLFLVSTIGQGTVPTSGDISKGAYGIWIEKGELTYPVSEVTLSGNLGKIMQDIEMIGNDPNTKSSVSGPTVKIKELTISGSGS